jgi:hypothetical protein
MKDFFKVLTLVVVGFSGIAGVAVAEESVPAKAKVVKNNASRKTKKAAHRVQEAVCAESDAECLAQKAKHRTTEAGEAVEDKASEIKGKHSK